MTYDVELRCGYKILTHNWEPPVQGGEALCDGNLPVLLPLVELDDGPKECSAGYNYCRTLAAAARATSFWPGGCPARCLEVEASPDAIERGAKRRCSQLLLKRLCNPTEIKAAMRELVEGWAGDYTDTLTQEQWLWYEALGRPQGDETKVVEYLNEALRHRNLNWSLTQFSDINTMRAVWAPSAAWGAWNAWDARGAWNARGALIMSTAVRIFGLQGYPADFLTHGIRDAYRWGLETAMPVGTSQLGWVMAKR